MDVKELRETAVESISDIEDLEFSVAGAGSIDLRIAEPNWLITPY
jgi:hypothetical protein